MKTIRLYDSIFAHAPTIGNGHLKIEPENFRWCRYDDIYQSVSVFTDFNLSDVEKCDSTVKVALLLESPEIFPDAYQNFQQMSNLFDILLTFDDRIIQDQQDQWRCNCDIIKYSLGGSWITPDDCNYTWGKEEFISFLASDKNSSSGHKLRHKIKKDCLSPYISTFGTLFNNYAKHKINGLRKYKYSIVVENCQVPGYFTEKLIDCFLTGTIPIYWGCPNIDEYFSNKGIIQFNSLSELKIILNNISMDDHYEEVIRSNFFTALKYYSVENQLWNVCFKELYDI